MKVALRLLFLAGLLVSSGSYAQTININRGVDPARLQDRSTAIQVQINFQAPLVTIAPEPAVAEQEVADVRHSLYSQINAECDFLSKAFDADCTILNINVNGQIPAFNNGMVRMLNANANYSLRRHRVE